MKNRLLNKLFSKKVSIFAYSAVLSLVNLLCFHYPFFDFVAGNVEHSKKFVILASLGILIFVIGFFAVMLVTFLLRSVGKILAGICHIISCVSVYCILTYHIILDDSMIANVFNTRVSEASGFMNWEIIAVMIFAGIIPAIIISCIKVDYGSWKRFGAHIGSSLGVALTVVFVNMNNFLWIGKYDTQLGGLLMPWSYIVNSGRLAAQHKAANQEEILLPDGSIDDVPTAVVLVIGESARKANFSLYGYSKLTNPLLAQRDDIHCLNAVSCATYTIGGTRAILEPYSEGALHEILPNYSQRCGVDVAWWTSNWGEPPVHVREYRDAGSLSSDYPDIPAEYDGILFHGVKERIERSDSTKVLIVLHTSTSHGPSYSKRYPPEFEKYTPVCETVEQAEDNLDALVNAYDNTIVYTDYLLASLIDTLESIKGRRCAMLFVSDHGESLGENGLYMHGLPISMAPPTQYEIPYIVWTGKGYSLDVKNIPTDQHSVFHSVARLLGINSPAYNAEKDIFLK